MAFSARNLNRPIPRITRGNALILQRYDWPGNVRELQHVIERTVITSPSGRLRYDLATESNVKKATPAQFSEQVPEAEILMEAELSRRERRNVLAALKHTRCKLSGEGSASDLSGIKPTTLAFEMKRLEIEQSV